MKLAGLARHHTRLHNTQEPVSCSIAALVLLSLPKNGPLAVEGVQVKKIIDPI